MNRLTNNEIDKKVLESWEKGFNYAIKQILGLECLEEENGPSVVRNHIRNQLRNQIKEEIKKL